MIRKLTDRLARTPPASGSSAADGERSSVGATAKAVAEDIRDLVRAELELAKAELSRSARAKAAGAVLLSAAAIAAWLALQALLIAAGFALALLMPAWAASLAVGGALLVIAVGAGLFGKRKLATPMKLETTKSTVEEDVEWVKHRLPRR